MHKHVDEANRRILEMLEASKTRRQNGLGSLSLADTILQRNELQSPKKPLKVKEIR